MSRIREIHEEVEAELEELKVELSEEPAPQLPPDTRDWLFDGERAYLGQLGHYRAYRRLPSLNDRVEERQREPTRACSCCGATYLGRKAVPGGGPSYCSSRCKKKASRQRKKARGRPETPPLACLPNEGPCTSDADCEGVFPPILVLTGFASPDPQLTQAATAAAVTSTTSVGLGADHSAW